MTLSEPYISFVSFKKLYPELREKEGRLYSDEQVVNLPEIPASHPLAGEWKLRRTSARKLVRYLARTHFPPAILEVGCGNGWLSRQLANVPGSEVTGIDLQLGELQQATRVFSHIPNLKFMYGDIRSGSIADLRFHFIIFAASIQYFSPLPEILDHAMTMLKPGGELHIIDSPIYQENEKGAAEERSDRYFRDMGFPDMREHYFHHGWQDLAGFPCEIMYRPSIVQHYIFQNNNPFPWIRIRKPG